MLPSSSSHPKELYNPKTFFTHAAWLGQSFLHCPIFLTAASRRSLSSNVADRPLRPAIDRRLGRPLPHQLPNLPRAVLSAINLSPSGLMRYYRPFPDAIPHQKVRSHVLLTSALLSCQIASYLTFPFNLHVLSLPPAFVLSQDQTLMLNDVLSCLITQIKNLLGSFFLRYIRLYLYLFLTIT